MLAHIEATFSPQREAGAWQDENSHLRRRPLGRLIGAAEAFTQSRTSNDRQRRAHLCPYRSITFSLHCAGALRPRGSTTASLNDTERRWLHHSGAVLETLGRQTDCFCWLAGK